METENNNENINSTEQTRAKAKMYFGWFAKRAALIIFDVLAVNFAYYLALVLRFYVHNEFRAVAAGQYLPAFKTFSPWYTIICVIVFILLRLYDSRWKHAGLHDLNRILIANMITAAVQVGGTLLFVRRMPITYYVIGAGIQFMLITASRFSYRIYALELARLKQVHNAGIANAMIVGIGETGCVLRRQIENDRKSTVRPVCLFAYKDMNPGSIQDGLPMIRDVNTLPENLEKYKVRCILLADPLMPAEISKQIHEIAEAMDIKVADYTGYLVNDNAAVTPINMLEYFHGPVRVVLDNTKTDYPDARAAAEALLGTHYHIDGVTIEKNTFVMTLNHDGPGLNDTSEAWVKDTEQATGQPVSFF